MAVFRLASCFPAAVEKEMALLPGRKSLAAGWRSDRRALAESGLAGGKTVWSRNGKFSGREESAWTGGEMPLAALLPGPFPARGRDRQKDV